VQACHTREGENGLRRPGTQSDELRCSCAACSANGDTSRRAGQAGGATPAPQSPALSPACAVAGAGPG